MKEYFNLNFMPSKSIRPVDGDQWYMAPITASSPTQLASADVQKAVAVCTTSDSSMPATFGSSPVFNVPPTGWVFNMLGFELNFTRVGSTLTLSARRLSPQTGPVEFRYGNNIYMLTSTVSSATDPKTIPTLSTAGKVWLGLGVLALWAIALQKQQAMTRRGFLKTIGSVPAIWVGSYLLPQDAKADTITVNSDAQGNYTIANLPVSLGSPVKLDTPTVDKTSLNSWETLTGRASPGSQVVIKEWSTTLATVPVDATGKWSYTGLTDGTHNLTLTSTDTNPNSACIPSTSLNATVAVATNDPMPTGPILPNVSREDNIWSVAITPINAGGVIDQLGRPISYTAIWLPIGLSINPTTGVITGIYDANGPETFSIQVIATPTGWAHPLIRTFVLSLIDIG